MEYKSTIKSRPYLYKETKKSASLINKGLDIDKLKNKALEENIFQLESEARKQEIASAIAIRLKSVDNVILDKSEEMKILSRGFLILFNSIWESFLKFPNVVIWFAQEYPHISGTVSVFVRTNNTRPQIFRCFSKDFRVADALQKHRIR